MNAEKIKNAKNFDELLDLKYGKIGTDILYEPFASFSLKFGK